MSIEHKRVNGSSITAETQRLKAFLHSPEGHASLAALVLPPDDALNWE